MPRILRIMNRFNLGGPTYNAAYLSKYLSPEFETLLVGGPNEENEENSEYITRNLGLNPVIIPELKRSISPKNDFVAYHKIRKIIKEFKPDIVHTHASKAGALGRRAAHHLNIPVIVHTFHGHVFDAYFSSVKSEFYKRIERQLAKHTTKIVALSSSQKNDLVNKYQICESEKIEIIPLGFDLNKFHENVAEKRQAFRLKHHVQDDEIAIGIIGRLVPIKNHTLFLEALKFAKSNTGKKIRAFIIGDGESREHIERKAQSLGLDFVDARDSSLVATITFTSWEKDIDVIMAGLDIVALSSLNEGTPVSLIEAQAANKPIVSTRVGGIQNIVLPDKTALLSNPMDKQAFYNNMLLLVDNAHLRQQLSREGWSFVKDLFHYERLVSDMRLLYHNLLMQ